MSAILASATPSAPALSQSISDNALRAADDAFGASVGREEIGIYNSTSVRGFDPTVAGNVRIEGLYVDLPGGVSDHVAQSTLIRVGVANIGTLLAAPSGIVDISLLAPGPRWQGRSRISTNDIGYSGVELDASGPLSETIGLNLGASAWGLGNDYRGVDPREFSLGTVVSAGDEANYVKGYASFIKSSRKVEPWFYPTGNSIPQRLPRDSFLGQQWSHYGYDSTTLGIVGRWQMSSAIGLKAGTAFSQSTTSDDTFDLIEDWKELGTRSRSIYRVPGNRSRAFSGEMQGDWTIAQGPSWRHRLSFGLRARTSSASFGGDVLAARADWPGSNTDIPSPGALQYGALSTDDTDQGSAILGWRAESERRGFVSLSIAPTEYRQQVAVSPSAAASIRITRDVLYSGIVGLKIGPRVTVFAGASKGVEASGAAPISAINRGEVLSAAITRQVDAGIRLALDNITASLAAFEISRPYPTELPDGRYGLAGEVRHRGVEGSLAGKISEKVSLLAGFYALDATLLADDVSANLRPVAVPSFLFQAGTGIAVTDTLNADATITTTGPQWLQTDGSVRLRQYSGLDLGLRYTWQTAGGDTILRLRLTNALNTYAWRSASDGGVSPGEPTRLSVSVAKNF